MGTGVTITAAPNDADDGNRVVTVSANAATIATALILDDGEVSPTRSSMNWSSSTMTVGTGCADGNSTMHVQPGQASGLAIHRSHHRLHGVVEGSDIELGHGERSTDAYRRISRTA